MDAFGVVYLIADAQQFWSELEETLHLPSDISLERLDITLRTFISLCASYHEQYLQSPLQLEHSCDLLLASELFAFHSERMCELLLDDAKDTTNPHGQLILYTILLAYGRKNQVFLRSHKRWQPLIPLFMDHIRIDIDLDIDDAVIEESSSGSGGATSRGLAIPIEVKLRLLSVRLLYEACRVQRLSLNDLRLFDDTFIDFLFELVEQTRGQPDETFNYSVIKLIVALNEQFMVASLPEGKPTDGQQDGRHPENENRVLRVLMARLGSSMTFGENMIFMLNRVSRSAEDRVMQLLILKILYLLFTTKGTSEYFYTNDLCVLVDVFLREILNLDEDHESLRHTFLRVLHPLLTKTQLKSIPYKRPQIVRTLESLIQHENIRDLSPTTKRLVQRCLNGEWCIQLRQTALRITNPNELEFRVDSPGLDAVSVTSAPPQPSTSHTLSPPYSDVPNSGKSLKTSRSVENLKSRGSPTPTTHHYRQRLAAYPDGHRPGSNDSSVSLPHVAAAAMPASSLDTPNGGRRKERAGSMNVGVPSSSSVTERKANLLSDTLTQEPSISYTDPPSETTPLIKVVPASNPHSHLHTLTKSSSSYDSASTSSGGSGGGFPPIRANSPRRAAPPPPSKRRKPPAVPVKKDTKSPGPNGSLLASSSHPVLGSYQ